MSGRYSEISIDQVIARTKMQLRLVNTSEWDDFFEVVIEEGLRALRPLSMYKKQQCTINVVNRQAKLPKGFYQLLGIRYNIPAVTGESSSVCATALYVDKKFLSDCNCDTSVFSGAIYDYYSGFQIVNGYIHWNTDIEDTEMTLAYFGFNLNENGRLVIYEDYERALSAYACYKYTQSWSDKYPQSLRMEYNAEWVAQRANLRGEDVAFHFKCDKLEVSRAVIALATSQAVNF